MGENARGHRKVSLATREARVGTQIRRGAQQDAIQCLGRCAQARRKLRLSSKPEVATPDCITHTNLASVADLASVLLRRNILRHGSEVRKKLFVVHLRLKNHPISARG